jgi:hypothetical protein
MPSNGTCTTLAGRCHALGAARSVRGPPLEGRTRAKPDCGVHPLAIQFRLRLAAMAAYPLVLGFGVRENVFLSTMCSPKRMVS